MNRYFWVLALLLVSMTLLVACGGNDDDAPTATSRAAQAAASPTVSTAVPTANNEPTSTASGPTVRVSPANGPRGTNFLMITTGLTADQSYQHVVRYPDGREDIDEAIYDESLMELVGASGPLKGEPFSIWYVEPLDPLGEYTVEIRDSDTGEVLTSTTFIVE